MKRQKVWFITGASRGFGLEITRAVLPFMREKRAGHVINSLEDYHKLCTGLHKMEHFFLLKANGGLIASQRRILSFLTSNARERYEQFLTRYPALLQRVPGTLIASYPGVSRETLSRLSA